MNNPTLPTPHVPAEQLQHFQQLMAKLMQCCQERNQSLCERFGLADAELRCLALFIGERYLTPKDLAQRLGVAKSRVTKVAAGLMQKGLLERLPDPRDSRVALLALSPAGRKKCKDIEALQTRIHQEVLARWDSEERSVLLAALERLRLTLNQVKEGLAEA